VKRLGLLVPALAAWATAALATFAPSSGAWIIGACSVIASAAWIVLRRRRAARVVVLLSALAVGAVAIGIAAQAAARDPTDLPLGRGVAVTMRVESTNPIAANGASGELTERMAVDGTLLSAQRDGRVVSAAAPVLAFTDRLSAGARVPGATLRFLASVARAERGDDVTALLQVTGPVTVISTPDALDRATAALRARLAAVGRTLPGDGGALLPGLAIGETSGVSPSLDTAMKASSLSHLTAVSGANCAVVTAAVFALAGLLRLPRPARVVAALLALGGFVVLVTPQPSVLRAATMAAIALFCLASGRLVRGAPLLSLAVVVLLVSNPWLARNAGFVLSVLATGGLLLLTRPISDRLARFLPERLALVLAVPIAAQLACQPVLILLRPSVPLFGVAANLLAEPAAPAATLLGLLACLVLPFAPPVGTALAIVGWAPAAWIAAVARLCAGLPSVPWLSGALGLIAAVVLTAAAILAAHRGLPVPVRAAGTAIVLLIAVGVVGGLGGSAIARVVALPRDWEIAACDVGQGDGLILNGGGGHYVMVDTGRTPPPIAACLALLGIGRIDLLVLTHWDADHVGAARSVASRVRSAFIGPSDGAAADALRADLVAAGVHVQQVHRGESTSIGRLRIRVLWPPDPLGAIEPGNAASVTLDVSGRLHSIFTGDLGEDAQNALLAAGPLPRYDVVKVAHHGSADQSPAFYAAAGAGIGLISVGLDNDYGHPTSRLLGILRDVGTQPLRTDESGTILISAGAGGGVRVWTQRPVTAAVWTPAR
jgi:competence protein ComEC